MEENGVKVRVVGLDQVHTLENNPREHNPRNVGMIADSIQEVGFMRPGVIDEDGTVWAGNGTTDAAIQAGYTRAVIIETEGDVAVYHQRSGLSPLEKLRYSIEDNQATLTSSWDVAFMKELIEHDKQLVAGLFNQSEIDAFLAAIGESDARANETGKTEYKPDPDRPPRIALGEIWQVGAHRIGCGDSTDPAFIQRLMGGRQAIGIFTSPPYAEQRADSYASIAQDKYVSWWCEAAAVWLDEALDPDGSLFLNIKAHVEDGQRQLYVMKLVLEMVEEREWRFIDEFCWKKQGYPGDYEQRFKNAWEPIYHFARTKKFKARVKNVAESRDSKIGAWYGPLAAAQGNGGLISGHTVSTVQPDNVIEAGIDGTGITTDKHPARFPVALPSFFIAAFSDPGDLWLEPFLGSGTTLVAAHKLGRICYGADLDPSYLETAFQRMEAEGVSDIHKLEEAPDAE